MSTGNDCSPEMTWSWRSLQPLKRKKENYELNLGSVNSHWSMVAEINKIETRQHTGKVSDAPD